MMYQKYSSGVIEVITGPMFSGKSEELIKRIKSLGYAGIKTLVVKPSLDDRWNQKKIISRAGSSIDTATIEAGINLEDAFTKNNYGAVAIDEAQFLDRTILGTIVALASRGIRVIISGLDQDFKGRPFGIMPQLLAIADRVDKQIAVCSVCHNAATMTYRKVQSKEQVLIGDDEYEPRCRQCHLNS